MRKISIEKKINLIVFCVIAFMMMPATYLAQNSITLNSNSGKSKVSIRNSENDFKIEYEGEIILSDDDTDIKDISRGGYIEIKISSFGRSRRIMIEKEGEKLSRKFFIGWSEKEYYPDGKNWLKDILPEIVRSTTIGAKSRVDRFYTKGGANAVLSEVKKMDSDYVQSAYFKLLLTKDLTTKEIIKTLEILGNTIKSDYYLSNILRKNQQLFLKNSEIIDAYITAAKSVNSDHYLTQIVKGIVSNKAISDTQLANLLKISSSINSDHYLSDVLNEVMDKRELNQQNMEQVMLLSKSINSDYYKASILKKALRSKNISTEAYDSFLSSLDDINSDHYVATIYKKIASRNDLTENQLISILNAIEKIESSSYLSTTLIAFAPLVKKSSNKVKDVYISVAKSINSETYFGRAMKAIY
jgi:hypothetical protein